MRILVTGAGGYIGRHLVPRLRDEGHEVVELHRANNDGPLKRERVTVGFKGRCFADLAHCSGKWLAKGLPESMDTVIHLAGRVEINLLPNPAGAHLPPVPGPCDIGALYRDNVLATANVLDYCPKAGVKHLIFASTQAVYGDIRPWDWDSGFSPILPLEHYAVSKRAAEMVLEMGRLQGLTVTILRLPGIYGGDRKSGAVYQMCRDAVQKGVVTVTATCPLPVNVLHLEDVLTAFDTVLKCNPQTYPIGVALDGKLRFSGPYDGETADVADGARCSLTLLANEIAALSGVAVEPGNVAQPFLEIDGPNRGSCLDGWKPKPRKERLAQVLEEIKRESIGR